jgi:hypothetical protein
MLRSTLFVAAALALSACATAPSDQTAASAERDCFNASTASGFTYVDEHHIKISAGPSRHYMLTTQFNARDLDWTQAIAIHSTSNWICTGNGLGVELRGGDRRLNYPISLIERLPEVIPADQGS